MSRSRFSIGNVLTKCSGIRKNGKLLTFEEVVQELNKLSSTNDAVEKDHKRLSNQLKAAYGKINELTKENEVLKSRIQLLSTLLDNVDAIIDLSDDDNSKRFWNKINEDAEQKWEEILKG